MTWQHLIGQQKTFLPYYPVNVCVAVVPHVRGITMAASEIDSLEQLLDKAGSEQLDKRELAEVKRILYGSPVE